jgi:hypothetical protein
MMLLFGIPWRAISRISATIANLSLSRLLKFTLIFCSPQHRKMDNKSRA